MIISLNSLQLVLFQYSFLNSWYVGFKLIFNCPMIIHAEVASEHPNLSQLAHCAGEQLHREEALHLVLSSGGSRCFCFSF